MSEGLGYRSGAQARPIGQIARRILREKRAYQKGKYGALQNAWAELVGEALAARTQIRSFDGGELVVGVDSSVLLHEMNGFMKDELLRQVQQTRAGRDVASLRFCLRGRTRDGDGP
ncbi:MAG: DUF721 domain-containing protein [Candidatus Brocadiia bacterium]